jgi:uncharacterized membrane protein
MPPNNTRHHPFMPLALLLIIVPALLLIVFFGLATGSFAMLGLTRSQALLFLLASVVGSAINIPLSRKRIQLADPAMSQMSPMAQWITTMFHYYPPAVVEQVIAVNVGGAVLPVVFSAYLLTRSATPLLDAGIATVVVIVVAKLLARPVPGVGITLPGFVPPIVAAIVSYTLVAWLGAPFADPGHAAPVAYISGTLGTLVGADLLNLPSVLKGGLLAAGPQRIFWRGPAPAPDPGKPRILSIGGAGIFDGIFLTGLIAAFLAA